MSEGGRAGGRDTIDFSGVGPRRLVLVVDDEATVRIALRRHLSTLGCEVIEADGAAQALQLAEERRPAVVFTDLKMPGTDGLTLLAELARSGIETSVVVISGQGEVEDVVGALRAGAIDYLKKPWTKAELASALERALAVHQDVVG